MYRSGRGTATAAGGLVQTAGVAAVERDGPGRRGEVAAEDVNQRFRHTRHLEARGRVLKPGQCQKFRMWGSWLLKWPTIADGMKYSRFPDGDSGSGLRHPRMQPASVSATPRRHSVACDRTTLPWMKSNLPRNRRSPSCVEQRADRTGAGYRRSWRRGAFIA